MDTFPNNQIINHPISMPYADRGGDPADDPTTFTGICFLTKPLPSLRSDPGDVSPELGTTIWNMMICSRR